LSAHGRYLERSRRNIKPRGRPKTAAPSVR
jgi:hypothetical protein